MKSILFALTMIYSSILVAENHVMVQAGKSFVGEIEDSKLEKLKNSRGKYRNSKVKKLIVKNITIKKGDTVTFLNKDTAKHNVFGRGFNLLQLQGSVDKIKFDTTGDHIVRCAIHPKMKLKIKVQ